MRKKRLAANTITALILQITTIICGFLLPRLILSKFGSEVNGLVNSITQFISIISFLDLGVGAVFQSSLYKPLADKDNNEISKVYVSGKKFFNKLGEILVVYIFLLAIFYPRFVSSSFDFLYVSSLIVIIGISSFAQYFFGMVNGLLITADQRGYIQSVIQLITIILNTISCCILIELGASIHLVKFVTSGFYVLRPIILECYVRKNYVINRSIKLKEEPIKQKWNGLAQHIASVVLESTDSIVLTLFASLADVSIYSVYYLVISGLKQLFTAVTNGIQSLIGELYARNQFEELQRVFGWTEWTIHTVATYIFGCTASLITPFVLVYTSGINDTNYNQPVFAIMIVLAYMMYTYRLPYHITIKASVQYKQTQRCYACASILNIILSVVLVWKIGLIGVAIGTLVAMSYQTIWMALYNSKRIVKCPLKSFFKQIITDLIIFCCGVFYTQGLSITKLTYFCWVIMAIKVAMIWLIVVIIINLIMYRSKILYLIKKLNKNH